MRARFFWRNVSLIALAHAIAIVALLRWTGNTKAADAEEITWLANAEAVAADAPEEPRDSAPSPSPASESSTAESELREATATPARPSATPKSTPRMTPRKAVSPKASATPAKKKKPEKSEDNQKRPGARSSATAGGRTAARQNVRAKASGGATEKAAAGDAGKAADAATANYYSSMLHDRFYRAWEQPQTVVASGVKFSATARIRIEKDGRVGDFKIVQPSGNVLVDESIAAAGRKVRQVDALPAGMGNGNFYDVNLSFELNPK